MYCIYTHIEFQPIKFVLGGGGGVKEGAKDTKYDETRICRLAFLPIYIRVICERMCSGIYKDRMMAQAESTTQ